MEKTVGIPKDYFIKSVNNFYKETCSALVRELFQNLVDAGASVARFEFSPDSYTCEDNGRGMSSERMEEALLTLGGTFKQENSVGGFGEAKILLLFCMESFRIHSLDTLATGSVLNYKIGTTNYISGTRISGKFHENFNYNQDTMIAIAKRVLSMCRTDVKVYVNGELIPKDRQATYVNDFGLAGKVYSKSSTKTKNKLYVRQNGVWMFDFDISTKGNLSYIVELKNSVNVLTSNRDGFRNWTVSTEFEKLQAQITTEKKVKAKLLDPKLFHGRKGDLTTTKSFTTDIPSDVLPSNEVTRNHVLESTNVRSVVSGGPRTQERPPGYNADLSNDFLVYPGKVTHIPKKLTPGNLSKKYEETALLWKNILLRCLETKGISETFSIGFTLDSSVCASRLTNNGRVFYLINPLDDKFQGSLRSKFWAMLVTAVHELAHKFETYHDTNFISKSEEIMGKVLKSGINPEVLIRKSRHDNL